MRVHSEFMLTCALLATMAGIDAAPRADAQAQEFASASPAQSGGPQNNAIALPPTGSQSQAGNESSRTAPQHRPRWCFGLRSNHNP
jgi:hypothetical protein